MNTLGTYLCVDSLDDHVSGGRLAVKDVGVPMLPDVPDRDGDEEA